MKKIFLFFAGLFTGAMLLAQAPESFKYQAVARDGAGAVMIDQSVNFRISILQGSVSGAMVYSERHLAKTNEFGLVNLEIGRGTADKGTMEGISWGLDIFFLKVEMAPSGGGAFQLMGTSQLLSVPYALHAKTVETGDSWGSQGVVADETFSGTGTFTSPLRLAQNGALTGHVLKWDGARFFPTAENEGPWLMNGINLHYNSGNVGVGTANPFSLFELQANSNPGYPHLSLTEDEVDYSRLMFRNSVIKAKNWTIAGLPQLNNIDSRLNIYYYDGTEGKDILSVTGEGNVEYYKTGPVNILPIAFGTVDYDGTILSGSKNFNVSEIEMYTYVITISGENYDYRYYSTIVSPIETVKHANHMVAYCTSKDGNLIVQMENMLNQQLLEQTPFSFVVYKCK